MIYLKSCSEFSFDLVRCILFLSPRAIKRAEDDHETIMMKLNYLGFYRKGKDERKISSRKQQ
jgi:hypothetical protein